MAVICVSLTMVNAAVVLPNVTLVAVAKPVPVNVTLVPRPTMPPCKVPELTTVAVPLMLMAKPFVAVPAIVPVFVTVRLAPPKMP